MNRKVLVLTIVAAAVFAVTYASVLNGGAMTLTHSEYTGPPIPPAVALSNNAFAIDMYKQVAADPAHEGRNIFFSPFSLYTAASSLYEGARGETASQMMQVFGFEPDNLMRHELMSNASSSINRNDPHATLTNANALWLDRQFTPYQEYVDIVNYVYRADVDRLDFQDGVSSSAKRINGWASDKTGGKITNIVAAVDIENAAAVLNNAVYFKGIWTSKFDPADTHQNTFWPTPADSVTADFMRVTAHFDYGIYENMNILRMPYKGDRLSMLVFLPSERDGVHDLEHALSVQNMEIWTQYMESQKVTVLMPRFETETDYTLKGYLSNLGMIHAFDAKLADFSGIVDLTKLTENLSVLGANQNAFVKVNEEGTTAAAVSAYVVGPVSEPPKFIADRPFIFAIQDDESGTILFMGRMSDPTM